MLPYQHYTVRLSRNGTSSLGTTEYFLGVSALTARRWDDAVRHLSAAVAHNHQQGFLPMLANSQRLLSSALLARGVPADHARAELELQRAKSLAESLGLKFLLPLARPADPPLFPPTHAASETLLSLEGDYWVLQHSGANWRLRDSVGMQLLARLLLEPGREFSAFALRAGSADVTPPSSDAGPVLDERAVSAYRSKRRELSAEIEQAEQWGDLGHTARARQVLAALEQQLSQAIGIGGKPRRAASQLERARVTVTKSIRAAVRRITREHPQLGAHLERSIRTGHICSYSPDPASGLRWHVRLPQPTPPTPGLA
jgi:non-specific serine/threonine protein kinase